MSKFKIGDKVRCLDSSALGRSLLTVGKEYVVLGSGFYFISVKCDEGTVIAYELERFELVESDQKPRDLPKYVIVEAKKNEFLEQVNELIAKGYKPQGGVAVDQTHYIQAMVLGD